MPLSSAEYAMLAAFRYNLRRVLAFSEQAAEGVGLTQQQYQALLVVRAHPGPGLITITGLAREMLIRHHSAVGMVDRLEELGMLRRVPSPDDRRKVGLRLTASGLHVFDKLASIHRTELRSIGRDVGRLMAWFAGEAGDGATAPAARRVRSANRGARARS
jgi:DNA-binding MarR family transcriptional regulator